MSDQRSHADSRDRQRRAETDWHELAVREVVRQLRTDAHCGLGAGAAEARLERYGLNALPTRTKTTWRGVFIRQFQSPLIAILVAAAVVALAIGETADAVTILLIVLLNGALGFVQEWRAGKALQALKRLLAPVATVVREGREATIDAARVVPGDVVLLQAGDRVPADLRLVDVVHLQVDESCLTGESTPASKSVAPVASGAPLAERNSMAWTGSAVATGRGRGLVVATGVATAFGRIAHLTTGMDEQETPLRRKLAALGKQLGLFAISVSIIVALVGWIAGRPLVEMFLTGVSLAVAVVPEGLPAVVTITLALGIRAMVRRRALLRRLQAAETLGSANVICTDKTGTLTKNEMTVQQVWLRAGEVSASGRGYDPAGHFEVDGRRIDYRERTDLMALLDAGLRCNNARLSKEEDGWHEIGDPTEAALVIAAYKAWLAPQERSFPVTEYPFDSHRKRMTIVEHRPDGAIAYAKGAPEIILDLCTFIRDGIRERMLTEDDRHAYHSACTRMADSGLRTLAIARKRLPGPVLHDGMRLGADTVERGLTLLGIVGMLDPPHEEAPQALALAQAAGIRVIMITGDAPGTALSIARRIGLPARRAISGEALSEMSDTELRSSLAEPVLFARATPEQKLRIVEELQRAGDVVAMTGDGVNDAPALKRADIGIAMGLRGTDVAREAADMVLMDDNFASIISAVEEGRRQYCNIQKFVRYLLSSNTGEVLAIAMNILVGGPLILLPVQILWMNLVTDGFTAVALGAEPAGGDVMDRPPRDAGAPILGAGAIAATLILGGYIGACALWLFLHYLSSPQTLAAAQTMAFTGIVLVEKMNVLNFRALGAPMRTVGFFSNPWLLLALILTIGLQACAVYVPFLQNALHTVPLGWADWALMVAAAAPIFIATEFVKSVRHGARARRRVRSSPESRI